ncbi:TetR/AcrR family transcriptional regulator [Nonomuraea sp. ZG12]|uniref:TetR/AcrR family transcriptional regulator n=1 Tax=Nonomuraea sp. ZG12 TaxID=3452207 RepID=UPI003F8A1032
MPKEHLEARRRQILDAARRCFIRNGFHATSMQDVLAEADLSTGAVYRYFKSKDDIIAATASEALAELAAAFEADESAAPPDLDDIVDLVLQVGSPPLSGSRESAQFMVQVWAEAMRSPALRTKLQAVMEEARRVVAGLVARHQRHGLLSGDVPAEHVADVLMALVDGFLVSRAVYGHDGHADAVAFRNGMRALMSAPAQAK